MSNPSLQNTAQRKALYQAVKGVKAIDERRFRTWEANLNATIRWNQQPRVKYLRGMNFLSDFTFAELRTKFLKTINPGKVRQKPQRRSANGPAGKPDEVRKVQQADGVALCW